MEGDSFWLGADDGWIAGAVTCTFVCFLVATDVGDCRRRALVGNGAFGEVVGFWTDDAQAMVAEGVGFSAAL